MRTETRNIDGGPRPIAVGTGLLGLDVVYSGDNTEPIGKWAGGTCGNVLVILSFLGWSTYPVSRLADNASASFLCSDLARWGVQLEYILRQNNGSTPIIVQRIRQDGSGHGLHYFSFRCPQCGRRLPSYRPVPVSTIRHMIPNMPAPALFFFDRISRGAIDMATAFRSQGALVFFEPSSYTDRKLFQEALGVSHIVKVSHEQWAQKDNFLLATQIGFSLRRLAQEGCASSAVCLRTAVAGGNTSPAFPWRITQTLLAQAIGALLGSWLVSVHKERRASSMLGKES